MTLRDPAVLLRVEHAVTAALDASSTRREALMRAAEAVAPQLGWAHITQWTPAGPDTLRCTGQWPGDDDAFTRHNSGLELPIGVGLPGWVWASGEPIWLTDVGAEDDDPRAVAAAAAGLHCALGFLIEGRDGPLAVVEAFSPVPQALDQELLETLAAIGQHAGRFVERRRAETAVLVSEARKRGILDAALDCVITIDHHGVVVEANPALETTFGWPVAEALGREMADLIVPEEQRDAHRAGLRRLVAGAEPKLLGHRIELEAIRRDASRIPVELTITRIDVPGPPLFAGHVRDISARLEAVEELRASRRGIIAAGDEARQRVERDLHDGAQQRLVAVSLALRLAQDRLESDLPEAGSLLAEARVELETATAELRELARGIHPSVLTEQGLGRAVAALARRAAVVVELAIELPQRPPERVEAAAYFVVAEALANVTRHAGAQRVSIAAGRDDDRLWVTVRDDGVGGADPSGSGLRGLADRVGALDGRLEVTGVDGGGTEIRAVLPCA